MPYCVYACRSAPVDRIKSGLRNSCSYVNVAGDRLPWFVTFEFPVIYPAYGVMQGFTHCTAQGIAQCCFTSSCEFTKVGRSKLLRGLITCGPPESIQILDVEIRE